MPTAQNLMWLLVAATLRQMLDPAAVMKPPKTNVGGSFAQDGNCSEEVLTANEVWAQRRDYLTGPVAESGLE